MKKRLKRLLINPETFFRIMREETAWRVEKGIPKDAELKGVTLDPYTQTLNLFIEHSSFEEIDVHSVAPILETTFIRIK